MSGKRFYQIETALHDDVADLKLEIAQLIEAGRELCEYRDEIANQLTEAQSALGVAKETNVKLAGELVRQASVNEELRKELAAKRTTIVCGPGSVVTLQYPQAPPFLPFDWFNGFTFSAPKRPGL